MKQLARQRVIVVHHIFTIRLHGVATRPFMEYSLDIAKSTVGKQIVKVVGINVIGNLKVSQVFKFFTIGEVIDCNDVVNSPRVQAFDDVATDKSGSASNYDFHSKKSFKNER